MAWTELSALIVLGLAGSGHCVGMCGGFALAIGQGSVGAGGLLARHVAYQAGKALTYVFLAVLLTAGLATLGRSGPLASAQAWLAIVAGVLMIGYGLMQLLEIRTAAWWRRVVEPLPACRAFAAVAQSRGLVPAFFTGWLNGFLPCGLLLTVLFQLAAQGSVAGAAVGAAVFGAATLPGLYVFGLAAHAWRPGWRRVLVRVAGALLVIFGALTIVRAFPGGRHWLHQVLPEVWVTVRTWCGF